MLKLMLRETFLDQLNESLKVIALVGKALDQPGSQPPGRLDPLREMS
jgi:hypothetical protein